MKRTKLKQYIYLRYRLGNYRLLLDYSYNNRLGDNSENGTKLIKKLFGRLSFA